MGVLNLKRRLRAAVPAPQEGYAALFFRDDTNLPEVAFPNGTFATLQGPAGPKGDPGEQGPAGKSRLTDAVAEYGADKTGATDATAAIQAAINAQGVGGTVYLQPGRYMIGSNGTGLVFQNSHVVLRGEGRADTILFTDHASATVVTFGVGAWYSGVQELAIDNGNAGGTAARVARTGGWAVDMGDVPYGYLRDVDIQWFAQSVRTAGHLATIERCNIRQFAQTAIGVGILAEGGSSANDKFFSDITMDSATWHASSSCLRVKQVASLRLSNLNLVHAGQVLDLFPDTGQSIPSVYAINSFFDQGIYCLRIRGGGTVLRSKFVQCWFSGNLTSPGVSTTTAGVFIDSANAQGIDLIDCDFYGCMTGLLAQPNGANDLDWACALSRFAGNVNDAMIAQPGAGHRFSFTDNRVGASSGFGNNGRGITVGSGTFLSYQIAGNRGLDNNTTPGIIDNGTTTLRHNKQVKDNMGALVSGILANLATAFATSTTAATTEAAVLTARIPANAVTPGSTFRIRLFGNIGATTGNPTFRVRVGTAGTVADTLVVAPAAPTGAANAAIGLDAMVTVRTAPASGAGALVGGAHAMAAVATTNASTTATVAFTPSAPWFITVTIAMSAATAGATIQQAVIEAVAA